MVFFDNRRVPIVLNSHNFHKKVPQIAALFFGHLLLRAKPGFLIHELIVVVPSLIKRLDDRLVLPEIFNPAKNLLKSRKLGYVPRS